MFVQSLMEGSGCYVKNEQKFKLTKSPDQLWTPDLGVIASKKQVPSPCYPQDRVGPEQAHISTCN